MVLFNPTAASVCGKGEARLNLNSNAVDPRIFMLKTQTRLLLLSQDRKSNSITGPLFQGQALFISKANGRVGLIH